MAMLQESLVHGLLSLQSAAVWQQAGSMVFVHSWLVHASAVHGLPSSQSVLVWQQPAIGVCEHVPFAGLHASTVHALPSSQLTAVPFLHTPLTHVSAPLQASPSEHEVPLVTAT